MEKFVFKSVQIGKAFALDPIDDRPKTWRVHHADRFIGVLQMPEEGVFHAWDSNLRYLTTSDLGPSPALHRMLAANQSNGGITY